MRQEVIADHNRRQRVQQRVQQNPESNNELPEGISSEFLAALPEDMAAEVVRDFRRQQQTQQQQEQQVNAHLNANQQHQYAAYHQPLFDHRVRHHRIAHHHHHHHHPMDRMRLFSPGDLAFGGVPNAGQPQVAGTEKGVQLLDRESIATVLMTYFMDQEHFNLVRLQVSSCIIEIFLNYV
jgi:hypothetical protein